MPFTVNSSSNNFFWLFDSDEIDKSFKNSLKFFIFMSSSSLKKVYRNQK